MSLLLPEPSRSRLYVIAVLAPAIAAIAPFLGGSTERWAEAIVLVLLGIGLTLAPPSASPHRAAPWLVGALLLLAATAVAPASLLGMGAWRRMVNSELGIALSPTISPQPILSVEAFALLTAGLAWWWWLSAELRSEALRESTIRAITFAVVALALLSLAAHAGLVTIPFWRFPKVFGPFPNHNQMSDLVATWALMAAACTAVDFQRRNLSWIFWMAGTCVLLTALVVAYSRAGIVIFMGGLWGWLLLEAARKRNLKHFAIATSIGICALTLFLTFGGTTLDRFRSATEGVDNNTRIRFLIAKDTLAMIRQAPWCGIGLGNFESLFALYRNASASPDRVLHPESDWLWLTSEMGWLGPALIAVLAALCLTNPLRRSRDKSSTLSSAAFVAALCFAIHGFVDVSGHRLGSALPALLLCAVACQRPRSSTPRWNPVLHWCFRTVGVCLLGVGALWLGETKYGWNVSGLVRLNALKRAATEANDREDFAAAKGRADEALAIAPMDWEVYFLRGVAQLYTENPQLKELAADDFRRARRLNPSDPALPMREAELWMFFDPSHCLEVWRDALKRSPRWRTSAFGQMISMAGSSGHPELRAALQLIAGDDIDLNLMLLSRGTRADFEAQLSKWLAESPDLSRLSDSQRSQIFSLWDQLGDKTKLYDFISQHPSYERDCWQALAREYASRAEFGKAVHLILSYLPPPPLPQVPQRPIAEAQRDFILEPRNIVAGYQLLQAYTAAGDPQEALATISKMSASPKAPVYLSYLRGRLLAQIGEDAVAWDSLSSWIK